MSPSSLGGGGNKFYSSGVQSPSELYAPRGWQGFAVETYRASHDANPAARLAGASLESKA